MGNIGKWIAKKIFGKKSSNQITNSPAITNNFSPNIQFILPNGNITAADSMSTNTSHNATYFVNGNSQPTTNPTAVPSQPMIASPIAPSPMCCHPILEPTSEPRGLPSEQMMSAVMTSYPAQGPVSSLQPLQQLLISVPSQPAPPTTSYLPTPEASTVPQAPSQPVISSPVEPPTTSYLSTTENSSVPQEYALPKTSSTEDPSAQPAMLAIVEWVKTTPAKAYALSDRAVIASDRGFDNSPQWVIRGSLFGDLLPGALSVVHEYAQVPWGGHQYFVDDIEVCCASRDSVRWVEASYGAVPPRAVRAGHTEDGERLYVGRAWQDGYLSPGKVHPSNKKLYIPFRCSEIAHDKYEVLCIA